MASISFSFPSIPYADEWANVYVQYLIDITFDAATSIGYYAIHMLLAYFYIGLCFYVSAMRADLKVRMQEIHKIKSNSSRLVGREFARKLFVEMKFHSRIFE